MNAFEKRRLEVFDMKCLKGRFKSEQKEVTGVNEPNHFGQIERIHGRRLIKKICKDVDVVKGKAQNQKEREIGQELA